LTSRSTLISDPQTALAMMFALDQPLASTTMIDGGHFIDADPECFQVLLNWLTYRKVLLPRNLTPQSVAAVAEVYGMTDLCIELERLDPLENTKKVLSTLEEADFSESLLTGSKWGIGWDNKFRIPRLTQNINDELVCADTSLDIPLWISQKGLDKKILVLNLHPTEVVTWEMCLCEGSDPSKPQKFPELLGKFPDRAVLKSSQTEAKYLGEYHGEFGTVIKGRGIILQECFEKCDTPYHVLCVDKK